MTRILINQASVKQKMGKYDEALQIYEECLEIRMNKGENEMELANVISKIG